MDRKKTPFNLSLRITLLSLFVFSICLFDILFAAMIGESAIDIPFSSRMATISMIPEGWSFFTRNPREEKMKIYKLQNSRIDLMDLTASNPKYIYGLNRKGRTVSSEIQYIVHKSESSWKTIKYGPATMLDLQKLRCDTVLAENKEVILRGKILIQKSDIIPWAWSSLKIKPSIPYQVKLIYVKISE